MPYNSYILASGVGTPRASKFSLPVNAVIVKCGLEHAVLSARFYGLCGDGVMTMQEMEVRLRCEKAVAVTSCWKTQSVDVTSAVGTSPGLLP